MPFQVGQLVLKKINFTGRQNSDKLRARFDGPFKVERVNENGVTYIITSVSTSERLRVHHSQIKLFREPPKYLKLYIDKDFMSSRVQQELQGKDVELDQPYHLGDVTVSDSDSFSGCAMPVGALFSDSCWSDSSDLDSDCAGDLLVDGVGSKSGSGTSSYPVKRNRHIDQNRKTNRKKYVSFRERKSLKADQTRSFPMIPVSPIGGDVEVRVRKVSVITSHSLRFTPKV
jgi:hypothetical protein